ncbi:MAG TPA: phosphatase PAP2 family protein [Bacteroidia bacterium]|jgi:membrane-associated phospholipid phosphatase
MKRSISIILLLLYFSGAAQDTDINILKSIHKGRNQNLDGVFRFSTHSVTPVSIALPITVLVLGRIQHDSIKRNKGITIGASILLAAGITTGMKYIVNRPRPYITYPYIQKLTNERTPSFPSGHTSDAFATATSISLAYPEWYVVLPSYLWAGSVGYSRMHLGVHYPGDVLAGALIGAGTSYVCFKVNRWIQKKY